MSNKVIRLHPQPGEAVSLQGLYLRLDGLAASDQSRPIIYANFLSSLDGRIALKNKGDQHYQLPQALKSDEDFRLFLELYAHADCIVTHSGYMRSLAENRLGNVLQIPDLEWAGYIHDWRAEKGLSKHPDIVVASGSLDFPWHESLDSSQQNVHIASGGMSSAENKMAWQDAGHTVHEFGQQHNVDVRKLVNFLSEQGYKSVYLVAGPQLLQDLIQCHYVDRFFVTINHQLLGGSEYKSILSGQQIDDAGNMQLQNLYMNIENSNGIGQWFADFSFK